MGPFVPVRMSSLDDYQNLLNQFHIYRVQINRARNELKELQQEFDQVKNLINSQAFRDEVYRQELRRRKLHFYLLIFLVQLFMVNVFAVWAVYFFKKLVEHRNRDKIIKVYLFY